MKNLISFLIIFFTFLFIATPSFALTNFEREVKETIRETVEEGKEASISPKEIRKNVREEVKEQVQERKEGLFNKVKNFVKKNLRFDARLTCTVTSLSPIFTVDCDGNPYTVNVSDQTKYVRKFGGKSSFAELKIGNEINVFGKFTDESKESIDAKLIRNLSIQKRWGVFFGEIITLPDGEKFIIKTIQRGELTVYYTGDTKLMNHKKETIGPSDIEVNMRVRVKGIWDKISNELRETEEIRVFPKAVSPTPTP